MPRPVVPICRLPRKRSVTRSSTRWYCVMRCALALTLRRDVSTPRACRASSSANSTSRSITTPLPITGVTPGDRMPEGSRCRAYFSSPMTTVWPALLPPLNLTTQSVRSPSRSVALPFPSSPHCTPTMTMAGIFTPREGSDGTPHPIGRARRPASRGRSPRRPHAARAMRVLDWMHDPPPGATRPSPGCSGSTSRSCSGRSAGRRASRSPRPSATAADSARTGSTGTAGERILRTAAELRDATGRPFALNLWLPHRGPGEAEPGAAVSAG